MKCQSPSPVHAPHESCGYDAAMARKLASSVAECSRDDVLDFNDLMGNPVSTDAFLPLDLTMRPDLGIEFVSKVRDPAYLSILSDPRLRWLKAAACMYGSVLPDKKKQPTGAEREAVTWAVALARDPTSEAYAEIVNACLICGNSTPGEVADLLGEDADHIAAYHDLFFNVIARRNDKAYIHLIAYPGKGTSLPLPMSSGEATRPLLALAMSCQNLRMFAEFLNWDSPAEATASLAEMSSGVLKDLIRRVPGIFHLLSGDKEFAKELPYLAIQTARGVLQLESKDDASGYGGGDDDFSKFAETLLQGNVQALEERIRQQMNEQN